MRMSVSEVRDEHCYQDIRQMWVLCEGCTRLALTISLVLINTDVQFIVSFKSLLREPHFKCMNRL